MELYAAEKLARQLFAEHLPGWEVWFRFTSEREAFGQCRQADDLSNRYEIVLSKYLVFLNSEEVVRRVILHEIAHARAGANHEHDEVWKAEARKLGIVDPSPWCHEGVGLPRTRPLTDREVRRMVNQILKSLPKTSKD